MKYRKTGIIFLLSFLITIGFAGNDTFVSRAEITSASIRDKQNQINDPLAQSQSR